MPGLSKGGGRLPMTSVDGKVPSRLPATADAFYEAGLAIHGYLSSISRRTDKAEISNNRQDCVVLDPDSNTVVLKAVDNATTFMLHGARYRCFPFDSRYGTSSSTVEIYRECVSSLVEGLFEGFNATVLAYGQTMSW
eukprot:jgi/Mesvir1/4451/Mv06956-RA.1